MKQFFLDNATKFITTYKDYTKDEVEKLQYGLEGLYLTITKSIIIILVSSILGIVIETLIILFLFNILRFTGFGFHAAKSSHCLLLSIILFSLLPFLFFTINLTSYMRVIIAFGCIIIFLLYAPADTIKRPLPNKKKRIIRKIFTLIISFIYAIFILNNLRSNISILLILSLLIEAIMVHPFTYKLFRQPYRNYQNYVV